MSLLIHHHAVAFVDGEDIWIQSFIGAWIQELSRYFEKIGLLVQVCDSRRKEQDYNITNQNVAVHRINPISKVRLSKRNQYMGHVCKEISPKYNILLIRGITPRQKLIYDNCSVEHKCFLLVGSLLESKPTLHFTKVSLITWGFNKVRRKELKAISRSAQMFANSHAIVKEISTLLGVQAGFMPTNTISKRDFRPLIIRRMKEPIKLLFCGRVVEEKGIKELIDAIKLLVDQNIEVSLEVVGSMAEDYKRFLTHRINKLNLNSRIRFHGFIPFGERLLNFYSDSHIYVLPSWHEGFPHSIWEAAATCTPVIVTPVGGISGNLSGDHVLFCKVRNTTAIAESILDCLTDPASTESRVENLYKLALNYTVEECAKTAYTLLSGRSL